VPLARVLLGAETLRAELGAELVEGVVGLRLDALASQLAVVLANVVLRVAPALVSALQLGCVVTVNGYTESEDMSEATLVVTSLGDPGEPARVLANRSPAQIGDQVTLANLGACRAQHLSPKEAS